MFILAPVTVMCYNAINTMLVFMAFYMGIHMKKEKLTLENIKYDLKYAIKGRYKTIIGLFFLLLFIFAITFWIFKESNLFITCKVAFTLAYIGLLVLIAVQIVEIIKFKRIIENGSCIVKDKLIGKQIITRRARYRVYYIYKLNFSSYGEFVIPDENYTWSSMYPLSKKSVENRSNEGEEFYLVLSKRHTGKILLAYNTKMFEFVE